MLMDEGGTAESMAAKGEGGTGVLVGKGSYRVNPGIETEEEVLREVRSSLSLRLGLRNMSCLCLLSASWGSSLGFPLTQSFPRKNPVLLPPPSGLPQD